MRVDEPGSEADAGAAPRRSCRPDPTPTTRRAPSAPARRACKAPYIAGGDDPDPAAGAGRGTPARAAARR